MKIEIEKISEDKTYRKVWIFWFIFDTFNNYIKVELDGFSIQYRRTKECKWVVEKHYSRLFLRDNNLTIEEVKYIDNYNDILEEAKQKLFEKITEAVNSSKRKKINYNNYK